jgi:linoleoyl-CoA desaturase
MKRHVYKIHNNLYDLEMFVKIHPGGRDMFDNLKSYTNITPMLYSYHKNIDVLLHILPKYEIPSDTSVILYDTNYTYESYKELKKLVYDEIRTKNIPLYWSYPEIAYNACVISVYVGTWGYCIYNASTLSSLWMVLVGILNMTVVALIFHESSHYAAFKNQAINKAISVVLFSPFISSYEWKFEHNYLHHSFTNTEMDEDFYASKYFLRYAPSQPHLGHHSLQHIYAAPLFAFVSLAKGPVKALLNKRVSAFLFFIILYTFGWFNTALVYGTTGVFFSVIAQISHIQHDCIMLHQDKKNDFLYNQVSSAINYRTDDLVTRLMTFGLDIQIEHHLFPNLPHSSLRKIQPIVRDFCEKRGIPYTEKSSFFPAIDSYMKYVYSLSYDKLKE